MCPTKEQRIPACNTINHASIFKFFKLETVFPSKKMEAINRIIKAIKPIDAFVNLTSNSFRYRENTCDEA